MDYPKLSTTSVDGKKVIVRVDIDVPSPYEVTDLRLAAMKPTVDYLLKNNATQIFLIGHMGRFEEGKEIKSTKVLLSVLEDLLGEKITFGEEIAAGVKINLLENLRSSKDEEENKQEFVDHLASLGDMYVNEAFATSHRPHASIIGLPKSLPGFLGMHFEKEIENLNRALENPDRPLVTLISGIKEDKVDMVAGLKQFSDKVLVAGRLPEYIDPDYGKGVGRPEYLKDPKLVIGRLIQDREDVTIRTVEIFENEIKNAKTIILAGVIGKYEEDGHRQGTQRIFKTIAESSAFKIAGGGDTETALGMFGLKDKFDWISVGGGAMLEYLIKKTLPGLEALLN